MSKSTHSGPRPAFWLRWIGHLWLFVFGWRIHGRVPAELSRAIFIAAPHTTNWDLAFMLAGAWVLDVRLSWMGKHTLFTGLGGVALRWMGGVAVNRTAPHGLVSEAAEQIRSAEGGMWLAVPPEGSRSRKDTWRSGFYRIAQEAEVSILFGFLDYQNKRVGVLGTLETSGDLEADMNAIRQAYEGIVGKFPELQGPIRLREQASPTDADASEDAH